MRHLFIVAGLLAASSAFASPAKSVPQTTDCYMLSQDHEVVPGDWSLTILFEGRPLVTKHSMWFVNRRFEYSIEMNQQH